MHICMSVGGDRQATGRKYEGQQTSYQSYLVRFTKREQFTYFMSNHGCLNSIILFKGLNYINNLCFILVNMK